MKTKPILLVEDDKIDALTVQRALKQIGEENVLIVAKDGETAISVLENHDTTKPFLILLDLNMPKMNGVEFLLKLKSNKEFKTVPVVVVTTSSDERDIKKSYDAGAAGYFIKPVDYNDFVVILDRIVSYWKACILPEEEGWYD